MKADGLVNGYLSTEKNIQKSCISLFSSKFLTISTGESQNHSITKVGKGIIQSNHQGCWPTGSRRPYMAASLGLDEVCVKRERGEHWRIHQCHPQVEHSPEKDGLARIWRPAVVNRDLVVELLPAVSAAAGALEKLSESLSTFWTTCLMFLSPVKLWTVSNFCFSCVLFKYCPPPLSFNPSCLFLPPLWVFWLPRLAFYFCQHFLGLHFSNKNRKKLH